MSNQSKKTTSGQSELMKQILAVRYTDVEKEMVLCKKLLDISEQDQYYYGCAFANIYLVDSLLAQGDYSSCDFYLLRGSTLCREHGFDALLIILCNFAGLYYQKLNDDQSALTYFLEGVFLAEKVGDISNAGIIYNNIGYSFAYNKDYETSKKYFELAFQTIEAAAEGVPPHAAATYLTNLAEICEHMGDAQGCLRALKYCDELKMQDVYSRIRQECGWCAYYAMSGDSEHSAEIVDRMLSTHLLELDDQFFICDMVEGLCGNMLDIGDFPRAKSLLDMILTYEYNSSLSLRYRIQILKIRCWEAFGETEKLKKAYSIYYQLAMELERIEDEAHAQSMRSKLNIYYVTLDRASMQKQVKALEDASQLDELTEIYNRRYFNKLVSKVIHQKDIHTLGFLMMDVDYFKRYNDVYGHFKGDDALRAVSRVLTDCAPADLYVSRYGGDEFVCLCINLSEDAILDYAQQIIKRLEELHIPHKTNPVGGLVSLSIGYCIEPFSPGMDPEELLNLADKALYHTKENFRGGYSRKRRL